VRPDLNIFYLDDNPEIAAKMHANIHVNKMTVECAQLLSNVHRRLGYIGSGCYKETSMASPNLAPMRWVTESLNNYRWAVKLGISLAAEYRRRFNPKQDHRTLRVLKWLKDHEPTIPDIGSTPAKLAMPDEYKNASDPVGSYRAYLIGEKASLCKWSEGETPEWFSKGLEKNSG